MEATNETIAKRIEGKSRISPVLVNKEMEIIEGQWRLEAVKQRDSLKKQIKK